VEVLALLDRQVLPDQRAHKDHPVHLGALVYQVPKAHKVLQVLRVLKVQLAVVDQPATMALLVLLVIPAMQDHRVR